MDMKIQLDPAISEWPLREAEAEAAVQYAILGGGSQNCHPKLGYPICSLALARFQSKIGPRREEGETKEGGRKRAAFYRFVLLTWFGGHGRLWKRNEALPSQRDESHPPTNVCHDAIIIR